MNLGQSTPTPPKVGVVKAAVFSPELASMFVKYCNKENRLSLPILKNYYLFHFLARL